MVYIPSPEHKNETPEERYKRVQKMIDESEGEHIAGFLIKVFLFIIVCLLLDPIINWILGIKH